MPISGSGWELHVRRLLEQTGGGKTRTVGAYQVFHDGVAASHSMVVDGVDVPLSGTTAESPGPSQNAHPATPKNPSRILAGTYPLKTSGGPEYKTNGYRNDLRIEPAMPGIELLDTGNRTDIVIHPGKDRFLSSIGCINLCTRLPDAQEIINYPGSRRRVIALIEDLRSFLGGIPGDGDLEIPNASVVIDEDELAHFVAPAAHADDSIDGAALAAANGVAVKAGAMVSNLHPRMAPVIVAVAQAASTLGLPGPVITSGNDSKHQAGSLHFKNRALDFRANNITDAQAASLQHAVAAIVGRDYDVIFEMFPANPANDHLHVEFDPK
ncbi:MAG: hypothetical protein QOJ27_1111 [Sphingomonadales bacterium]|nr:hypothetical protein [Sphingomonadales bacterium]